MSFPKTATLAPVPFRISTPQADLDDLKTLLRLSPLPPPTYEGTQRQFGVTSKWMAETKTYWETQFDWRAHEAEINKHAQYTVAVSAGAGAPPQTLHFLAHVSADAAAVPLLLLHGWPGSFVEFLGLVDALAASTGPAFTVIVPSLPGYAFSEGPPVDRDFEMAEAAALVNALMVGLGYGAQSGGYVAQGGDIGSFLATRLQQSYEDCRAIHLNALFTAATHPTDNLTPTDLAGLARAKTFRATGMAYAHEHATRPSTIGHVLSSSPVALLAWVGEKLLEWTDADPDVETVLRLVSLWWFTKTAPRAVYPYREMLKPPGAEKTVWRRPVGYSLFPAEIVPTPRAWAALETEGRMVWFREHEAGGHFAAMEKPQVLARDLAEFVVFLGGLGN